MLYAIVAVIILILDQSLKYWATLTLPLETSSTPLIPGILGLTRVHNYGGAFGILQNMRWLFVVAALLFTVAVIFLISKKIIAGRFGRWMAVCIAAGALGNVIDRFIHNGGYVVDMLKLEFFPSFPIFNIADIFVTVGGVLFCLYIIFHKDPAPAETSPRETPPVPPPARRRAVSPDANAGVSPPPSGLSNEPPRRQQSAATDSRKIKPNSSSRVRVPEENSDTPRRTARPSSQPNAAQPPKNTAPAPQTPRPAATRRPSIDTEMPEFTLEDILAEFSDKENE